VSPVWQFDTEGDARGWVAYFGGLDLTAAGPLRVHAYSDATILSPSISVPAVPLQLMDIEMASDAAGDASAMWARAQAGTSDGFSPADAAGFALSGDGLFHHYYVPIDTSSATSDHAFLPFGTSRRLQLPGKGHSAKFATELIPDLPYWFTGELDITAFPFPDKETPGRKHLRTSELPSRSTLTSAKNSLRAASYCVEIF
jgi:hypothetical protein